MLHFIYSRAANPQVLHYSVLVLQTAAPRAEPAEEQDSISNSTRSRNAQTSVCLHVCGCELPSLHYSPFIWRVERQRKLVLSQDKGPVLFSRGNDATASRVLVSRGNVATASPVLFSCTFLKS